MEQFLLTLCGLPASGKTSLAQAIREALNFDTEIVSSDEWRDAEYYTDWKPEKEGRVRQASLIRTAELLEQGKNVIHDDTNYYKSMRHDLFRIALQRRCSFAIVHVTTSLENSITWNNMREHSNITENIIRRIDERFDPPGGRYLWDYPDVEVDMANQSLDSVIGDIIGMLETLEVVEEPRPIRVTESTGEIIDQITRETVNEFLKEHPELRGNREVSEVRRNVLKNAIEGNTDIKTIRNTLLNRLHGLID